MAERVHRPGSFVFFGGVGVDFFMICFYATQKKYGTPKMEIWKINVIFKGMIFRFYVNFQGCTVDTFQVFEFGDFLGEMCKNRSDSLSKQLRALRSIIEAAKLLRLVGQLPDWHVFHLSPHEFCKNDVTSCHKRLNNNTCIAYACS